MLDDGQGAAGVCVDDDGDIAVAFAHGRLIDQQHRAPPAAAMLRDEPRPGPHQRVDDRPAHTVAARHRADRHRLRVRDQTLRQATGQPSVELGVLFEPSAVAAAAHEPAPHPHQRRAPPRHLQVAHLALAGVMDPVALEPAVRATRTPHGRLDPHPQLLGSVHNHRPHADLAQVQPHPHNIGSHRGPPGSLIISITDSSRASTPAQGPSTTPLPMFTRRLNLSGLGRQMFLDWSMRRERS